MKKILIVLFSILFSLKTQLKSKSRDFASDKRSRLDTSYKSKKWNFTKIVGQTLYFSNGKKFKTNLFDLKYIGQLKTKAKAPYLILSGRSCNGCGANASIYVHSPSDGPMEEEARQVRYSYPGREFYYLDNTLVFESKMFYGSCLKEKSDCVVWVQRELNEKKIFEMSILILEVENDTLKESYIKNDSYLTAKQLLNCIELEGIETTSEP